ncbi:MAG: TusE/DsrC/DsvC family sulfur relay protein [Deltaproteobacteria bacterium]|nr:TusE/DsrC/DsvC family sulfur relay protein [Deltaproteobacteria bacterium]
MVSEAVATPMPTRDVDGFLCDSAQWTPALAEALAREVGMTLTPEHWQVLTFCREDFARQGVSPGVRRVAQLSGIDMKALYRLFPKGPGKLAAKLAGIPKPKSCL